jgi:hypothetical protein
MREAEVRLTIIQQKMRARGNKVVTDYAQRNNIIKYGFFREGEREGGQENGKN